MNGSNYFDIEDIVFHVEDVLTEMNEEKIIVYKMDTRDFYKLIPLETIIRKYESDNVFNRPVNSDYNTFIKFSVLEKNGNKTKENEEVFITIKYNNYKIIEDKLYNLMFPNNDEDIEYISKLKNIISDNSFNNILIDIVKYILDEDSHNKYKVPEDFFNHFKNDYNIKYSILKNNPDTRFGFDKMELEVIISDKNTNKNYLYFILKDKILDIDSISKIKEY